MTRTEAIADLKEEIAIYESLQDDGQLRITDLCPSTYEAMKIAAEDMETMERFVAEPVCSKCGAPLSAYCDGTPGDIDAYCNECNDTYEIKALYSVGEAI